MSTPTTGASGFPKTIEFRGEIYSTPDMEDLETWVFDSLCETPDGRTVEPDHPDSWLMLLGLI